MSDHLIGIYGASGFGRGTMHWLEQQCEAAQLPARLVFIDDHCSQTELDGLKVLTFEVFRQQPEPIKSAVIALADSQLRQRIDQKLTADGVRSLTLRGGYGVIRRSVTLGEANLLGAYVSIDANVKTGRGFHCLGYSYVGHDCVIGDYVTFGPRVSCNGHVVIEDHAYIGSSASIRQGMPGEPLVIGRGAVVGMGAVVTRSVPAGATVLGNPAHIVNR